MPRENMMAGPMREYESNRLKERALLCAAAYRALAAFYKSGLEAVAAFDEAAMDYPPDLKHVLRAVGVTFEEGSSDVHADEKQVTENSVV